MSIVKEKQPSQHLLVQNQQWKEQSNILCVICSKPANNKDATDAIVNFEQNSHIVLVFLLLTLSKWYFN